MSALSKSVKILLVDDLKKNLLALEGVLKRDDLEIFTARSGTEALEIMILHEFAIALIDVQMPLMSGFELAEFMRGVKKTKTIPIIFVTATANDQSFSFKGYESGAVDFLLKPLDAVAVRGKVDIFVDMYRRKRDLLSAEAKFRGLLETAPDAIVIANDLGVIEIVNARTEIIFGYNRKEMIGHPMEMLIPERFRDTHIQHRSSCVKNSKPNPLGRKLELFGRRKDGSEFPMDISLSPLQTENGTLISSAIRDTTERHAAELIQKDLLKKLLESQTALKNAVNVAETANLSKTEFLANMSHEIRTPIGALLGFTDLMKDPANSTEENRKYMMIIERNSQQLLRLIDDILDLSKVESGKMTIETIPFSLTEMLSDFDSIMSLVAKEKDVEFRLSAGGPIPDSICADPYRLRQILTNVAGNALKFTDRGYVELRVDYTNSKLKFTVRDTGIGISPIQAKRLFQPFSQADTSTTRKFGGTGLGLVLSRRLADALGGTLELTESGENAGSTFVLEIATKLPEFAKLVPLESKVSISNVEIEAPRSARTLGGLNVLLVEDSLDNQMLITMYLNNEGAIVKSVGDGAQGVALALRDNFDVLLMDIQMPVLDGHEAAKRLRNSNYVGPIVALTAHAMKEERLKCIESGFNQFLTKPIQKKMLIEVLSRYVKPKITASLQI